MNIDSAPAAQDDAGKDGDASADRLPASVSASPGIGPSSSHRYVLTGQGVIEQSVLAHDLFGSRLAAGPGCPFRTTDTG
jgi:hypothetical protein